MLTHSYVFNFISNVFCVFIYLVVKHTGQPGL